MDSLGQLSRCRYLVEVRDPQRGVRNRDGLSVFHSVSVGFGLVTKAKLSIVYCITMLTSTGGVMFLRRSTMTVCSKTIRSLSSSVHRVYPTSTMDLVDMEESVTTGITSTWQYVVDRDFCPSLARPHEDSDKDSDPALWDKLVAMHAKTSRNVHIVSHELDLIEACERRKPFDKILLLSKHCEQTVASGALTEPSLTFEGVGQALSLARRISTFCNDETKLLPELVVVAPLRRAIQTSLLSFPQYSPHTVRAIPWICHPNVTASNYDMQDLLQLQKEYTGLDYALCYSDLEGTENHSVTTSTEALLSRADSILDWLRSRDEKVIVGK